MPILETDKLPSLYDALAGVYGRRPVKEFNFAGKMVKPQPSAHPDFYEQDLAEALRDKSLHRENPEAFREDIRTALTRWVNANGNNGNSSYKILEYLIGWGICAEAPETSPDFTMAFNSAAFSRFAPSLKKMMVGSATNMVGNWVLPEDAPTLTADNKKAIADFIVSLTNHGLDTQDSFVCLTVMAECAPEQLKTYYEEKLSATIGQDGLQALRSNETVWRRFGAALTPLIN